MKKIRMLLLILFLVKNCVNRYRIKNTKNWML